MRRLSNWLARVAVNHVLRAWGFESLPAHMKFQNTKQQGDLGVASSIFVYTKFGYIVSVPLTDNARYDLVVDKGDGPLRVQVKTCDYYTKSGNPEVSLRTLGGNQSWSGVAKKLSASECDLVFIHVVRDSSNYEIPSHLLDGRSTVTLGSKYLEFRVD